MSCLVRGQASILRVVERADAAGVVSRLVLL